MARIMLMVCAAVLAGCGDSSVDAVRKSYMDREETITLSQALDHREECEKPIWTSFMDAKGRKFVEYKFTFKNSTDFLGEGRRAYVASEKNENDRWIDASGKTIQENQSRLDRMKNFDVEEWKEKRKKEIEDAALPGPDDVAFTGFLEKTREKIAGIQRDGDLGSLEDFLLSLRPDMGFGRNLAGLDRAYPRFNSSLEQRFFGDGGGSFWAQYGHMSRKRTESEKADYKARYVEPYVHRAQARLSSVIEFIDVSIAGERDRIEKLYQDKLSSLREGIVFQLDEFDSEKKNISKEIDSLNEEIKVRKSRNEGLDKQSFEKFPEYQGMEEIFQWTVNKEGKVALSYGEISAIDAEGKSVKTLVKHTSPESALRVIAGGEFRNYKEYLDGISAAAFLRFLNQ